MYLTNQQTNVRLAMEVSNEIRQKIDNIRSKPPVQSPLDKEIISDQWHDFYIEQPDSFDIEFAQYSNDVLQAVIAEQMAQKEVADLVGITTPVSLEGYDFYPPVHYQELIDYATGFLK